MSEAVIDAKALLKQVKRRVEQSAEARRKAASTGADEAGSASGPDEQVAAPSASETREGAERKDPNVTGARGRPALKGGRRAWPVGARTFFVALGVVVLGLALFLLSKARHVRQERERREVVGAEGRIERHVPALELAMVPGGRRSPENAPGSAELVAADGRPLTAATSGGPGALGSGPEAAPVSDPNTLPVLNPAQLIQRRLAPGFGGEDVEGRVDGERLAPPPGPASGAGGAAGSLEQKLESGEVKGASARMLADRDYLLTQGAMLDCVLETRLVSTVPGMTSCHLTRDIYSTNGHVVLLDRGSRVVGHYQGGPQQGEARIFVVWTRVETPRGVVVELQSPGTGPLGEAGVDGWVDTHFWDRFGAAILLSIIQDATDAAASRAAGPGQSAITFSNQASAGKQVVERSMEPTLNIPPTIVKNQGERLGIFVARDLDFSSVYELERAAERSDREHG